MLTCAATGFAVGGGPQRREQYPGQSEHAEPPPGWSCSNHPSADANHKCDCVRKCVPKLDENGNPTGEQTVQEDQKCGAWCHPNSCSCPVKCKGETH
jgi:hypothetical protein